MNKKQWREQYRIARSIMNQCELPSCHKYNTEPHRLIFDIRYEKVMSMHWSIGYALYCDNEIGYKKPNARFKMGANSRAFNRKKTFKTRDFKTSFGRNKVHLT